VLSRQDTFKERGHRKGARPSSRLALLKDLASIWSVQSRYAACVDRTSAPKEKCRNASQSLRVWRSCRCLYRSGSRRRISRVASKQRALRREGLGRVGPLRDADPSRGSDLNQSSRGGNRSRRRRDSRARCARRGDREQAVRLADTAAGAGGTAVQAPCSSTRIFLASRPRQGVRAAAHGRAVVAERCRDQCLAGASGSSCCPRESFRSCRAAATGVETRGACRSRAAACTGTPAKNLRGTGGSG